MLSYLVILLTMIGGAAQAPWWFGLAGGATLAVLSLRDQHHMQALLAANDNLAALNPAALYVALLHGTLGACAYPLGYAIRAFAP